MLVPGAGAGAVHVVETGWCWRWCWVPGARAGAGAVSWLCTWCAGCRCWCCELAVHVVETGRRCWAGWWRRRCWVLVETGCWVLVLGAGYRRWVRTSQRQALNRPLLQHVSACYTFTTVVLDTAWPWASEAYGLCRLRAYSCAHKLIRARSYGLIVLQIVASSMLQIVALDTAWPWANGAYGLCCLRA